MIEGLTQNTFDEESWKTVGSWQKAVGKGCSYRGHKNLLKLQKFKVRVNIEKKLGPILREQRAVGKTYSFSEHKDLLILQIHIE